MGDCKDGLHHLVEEWQSKKTLFFMFQLLSIMLTLLSHVIPGVRYLESFWSVSLEAWVLSCQPFEFLHTWLGPIAQQQAVSSTGLWACAPANIRVRLFWEWPCSAAAAELPGTGSESKGTAFHQSLCGRAGVLHEEEGIIQMEHKGSGD